MTTACTAGSAHTASTLSVTLTCGNRARTCSSRPASLSTTVRTVLAGGLSKFRIRFGPQWPAPTTATVISLDVLMGEDNRMVAPAKSRAERRSLLDAETQVNEGSQHRPPTGDRPHLR